MSNLFLRLKNLPFYLCYAFIFSAFVLIAVNVLGLFSAEQFQTLYEDLSASCSALFAASSGALITYYVCQNSKKAIAASFCVLLFDFILFSLTEVHISFIFSVILSLLFSSVFEKSNVISAFFICALISITTSLLLGFLYEYLFELLKAFCSDLKGKGALFGTVNNFYSIMFSNNFEELFYHKEYSGAAYINGNVISGVMDIFTAQEVAGISVSKYLSGKYFVNIFLSIGLFITLYARLDSITKGAFASAFILSVIFGDARLLALFILIYNPAMYLGYLLLIMISYLVAYLLDIRLVYFKNGSLFELFTFGEKYAYFFLSGIVLIALTYFLESIILSKFDFQSRKIIPREVKQIVNALGGEGNIERIKGEKLFVKNANLIDILRLDCDIKENLVLLNYDDLELLKKFY